MRDRDYQSPGNAQVVEGLEMALKRARLGAVHAAGVIFCEHATTEVVYLGDQNARPGVIFGCEMLKHTVLTSVTRIHQTVNQPPANKVSYDLNRDPLSFDFIPWLATQEMTRRREHAPAPLRVSFVASPHAIEERVIAGDKFIENVIRPALALFDAVEGVTGEKARHADFVGLRDIGRAYAEGEKIPQLIVPPTAASEVAYRLGGRRPVTMTLRETEHSDFRNSNLDEWRKMAEWLCAKGEDIIVVRDTAYADEQFHGFETFPKASLSLHHRVALYDQAKCNLFVQNGPYCLMPYMNVPWLLFASVEEDNPEHFNRPGNWQMVMPTNRDGQLPWQTPQQKIIYGWDTFEIMSKAYEELPL